MSGSKYSRHTSSAREHGSARELGSRDRHTNDWDGGEMPLKEGATVYGGHKSDAASDEC